MISIFALFTLEKESNPGSGSRERWFLLETEISGIPRVGEHFTFLGMSDAGREIKIHSVEWEVSEKGQVRPLIILADPDAYSENEALLPFNEPGEVEQLLRSGWR